MQAFQLTPKQQVPGSSPGRGTIRTMIDNQDQSDFTAQWESWHREHELQRARPHGFLAITSMNWLDDEPQRFDDVAGAWSSDGDGVRVLLGDGEELLVEGARVSGEYHFHGVDEIGTRASFGDAIVEVCRRDRRFMIRPRHPDHVVRTSYLGTPTYPLSIEWVVTGALIPYDPPQSITVGATVEGLEHVYESPGEVEIRLVGQVLRLIAFNDEEPDDLFIVFTDETSGSTSYSACRFLTVYAPGSRWSRDARFQSRDESTMRVHRLRHVPAASRE
jgi:uncharacterized protein (DUF1684 family)